MIMNTMLSLSASPSDYEWILQVDWARHIIMDICIIIVGFGLYELKEKICNKFGWSSRKKRKMQQLYKQTAENTKDLEDVKEGLKELKKLIPMMDEMNKSLSEMHPKITNLEKKITTIEEKQNTQEQQQKKTILAQHKDKLYRLYRYYKDRYKKTGKMEWTQIEYDRFWDIFDDYEAHGGNGYMHETVEPFMRQFVIVPSLDNMN